MGMPKGRSGNPDGRPKGTENKSTTEFRDMLNNVINGQIPHLLEAFDTLREQDKFKYMVMVEKFMAYTFPKKSMIGVGIDESIKEKLNSLFPFEPPDADLQ